MTRNNLNYRENIIKNKLLNNLSCSTAYFFTDKIYAFTSLALVKLFGLGNNLPNENLTIGDTIRDCKSYRCG